MILSAHVERVSVSRTRDFFYVRLDSSAAAAEASGKAFHKKIRKMMT